MATMRSYAATTALYDPLAQWRFNEGAGTTLIDWADDLDGRYQGGPTFVQGQIGDGGARFDGSGSFAEVVSASAAPVRLAVIGDSLVEGFGLAAADAFPDDLVEALEAQGLDIEPIVDGRSGFRIDQMLDQGAVGNVLGQNPDAVIIVLGTNDAMQGRDPVAVAADLRTMIQQFQAADVDVLLTSTFGLWPDEIFANAGYGEPGALNGRGESAAELAAELEAIFPALAAELGVALFGPFTAPVRENPGAYNLVLDDSSGFPGNVVGPEVDGVHPNAAGVDQIVSRILPEASALVRGAQDGADPLAVASGSIEMWFKANSLAADGQALFAKAADGSPSPLLGLLLANGRVVVSLDGAGHSVASAVGSVAVDQLTQLVFTFGAGGMRLYLNGQLVDQDAFTGGLEGNLARLLIGAVDAGGVTRFLDGMVDELALYDRALAGNEVSDLFVAGSGPITGTDGDDLLLGGVDDERFLGRGGADEIRGGDGDDTLQGGDGRDDLRGEAGRDVLIGGNGHDQLAGGAGRDLLLGQAGDDRLTGGDGDDDLRGASGADTIIGGAGDDDILGGNGADDLRGGDGADLIAGRDGADELFGGRGDDELEGNVGRDIVRGEQGNDQLLGNLGSDRLRGGQGDDLLDGGADSDDLDGGAGADRFRISRVDHGVDKIADFEAGAGGDVIDLSAVLDFGGGDDVSDFVALIEVKGNTKLAIDPDGAGHPETIVFNLLAVTGLDLNQMVSDGNLALS